MHVTRSIAAFLFFILLPSVLLADCVPDYRSDKKSGLFVADFMINGTVGLDSSELAGLRRKLIGACVNEDSEELQERVRALFEDEGYMGATVSELHIKTSDPLAVPKAVTVEAEVAEGLKYRLAEITFSGNHAVSIASLRNGFPLRKGDFFTRNKVASGIMNLRNLYLRRGFMDFTAIPDTQPLSNSTMRLAVTVNKGTQYHMGELKIFAKKELADRLSAGWKLQEGSVFNSTYPDKYISTNRSLLPAGFTRSDIVLVQDCPNASIEVRLIVEQSVATSQSQPLGVPCESPHREK